MGEAWDERVDLSYNFFNFPCCFFEFRQDNVVKGQAVSHIASQLGETISFIDIGKRSLEKREGILKEFMEATNISYSQLIDQKDIQNKLTLFSGLLESCRAARRIFVDALAKGKNPLLNPDISDAFNETITEGEGTLSFPHEKPSIITLQEENAAWGNLCWLCE